MQTMGAATYTNEAERRRVRAVVEALTRQPGHSAAEVAHDARNMVTALELYSDLLGEPGVLMPDFHHYASELKLVASASRRLVEKLMVLDGPVVEDGAEIDSPAWLHQVRASEPARLVAERLPGDPIDNLAREVEANGNLLDAIAGISITVTVKAEGGAYPVRLTAEDLTRVLVNLVKNASEAMRRAGRIEIVLREREGENGAPELVLAVEDNGPGIREGLLDQIFEPGFTTHASAEADAGWPASNRGLGLSITRTIVQAAGGRIYAENRSEGGARIVIELPVRQK